MLERALVIGAHGQVGRQLGVALAARSGGHDPVRSSRVARDGWVQLDLAELTERSQAAHLLDGFPLNAIYCVGGMTYVDGCEAQPEIAYRINGRGPGVLAGYANSQGIPFVYYSTEYVFAGREEEPGPYTEDSPTDPLSVYGKSKLLGERQVLGAHPQALVLRTTVVYGPDEQQKNFLYTVMNHLRAGKVLRVPRDQISTPTYNRDLVAATLGLVESAASGIFHVCGPEVMGRLEFAQRVASFCGLDATLLEGTSTSDLNQPATRPLFACLSSQKLSILYPNLQMRTISQALDDCAAEL